MLHRDVYGSLMWLRFSTQQRAEDDGGTQNTLSHLCRYPDAGNSDDSALNQQAFFHSCFLCVKLLQQGRKQQCLTQVGSFQ